jgi:hypothetical protein
MLIRKIAHIKLTIVLSRGITKCNHFNS